MTNEELEQAVIDYITKNNMIAPSKLIQAKIITSYSDNLIYEVLHDLNLLTVEQLNEVLSEVTGYPVTDPLYEITQRTIPEELFNLFSNELVLKHIVFPFRLEDEHVHVAMSNPTDSKLVEELEKNCGKAIKRHVCYFKTILRAIVRHYPYAEGKEFNDVIEETIDEVTGKKDIEPYVSIWTEPLGQALQREISLFTKHAEAPREGEVGVSILIQKVLDYAIYIGATDIHIEPYEDAIKVRLRKDGILATQWYLPKIIQSRFFNRLKVMAKLQPTLKTQAQNGSFTYENVVDTGVDIRIATVPSIYGERFALRLLDKNKRILSLTDLGMSDEEYDKLIVHLNSKQGLILVVGPTGSGKTTTIYAALEYLNRDDCSIMTLESPIEYQMRGINQIHVDFFKNYSFDEAFEDVLRQDPDIILLGEILDQASAETAIMAAATGHLIFSTLHATCSAFAVPRLLSLGATASILSDVLQVVLAQRLIRVLCPHCKKRDSLSKKRLKILGLSESQLGGGRYFVANGCDKCNQRGYYGQIGVFELLIVDENIRDMILKGNTGMEIYHYAIQQGMIPLFSDAMDKAKAGITSLDEVVYRIPTEPHIITDISKPAKGHLRRA
ncbi:GspE/PulE family protein [Spartinivicinus poritis]|uniref:GspE/PulE family protein n=1 Tax=Spartinivicinus poritis TaxID=2994640 RepID=A0ABT5U9F3_9GAMM|nr:GspE/PulE family protein [Spartinivicinus sp. A2-2]MDE1462995.1 GspE/PulE family protein [Spartinivicinus sp. A2-2]